MSRPRAKAYIALFLLTAFLSACGGKNMQGSYQARYDLRDTLNREQLTDANLQLESPVYATYQLRLEKDKTFTLELDAGALRDSVAGALRADADSIVRQLLTHSGIQESSYDWVVEASGFDTFEAFRDDAVEELVGQLDMNMMQQFSDEAHREGAYKIKKDILTLQQGEGDGAVYQEGTVTEDGKIVLDALLRGKTVELTFSREE